jgi:predicted DCC family thiol-disulfide oxidoreductase YuxK
MGPVSPRHYLLWDGACGFCRRAVEWLRRRDTKGVFEILPYQDAPSPPMTAELREACRRAVHVVTADGRVLRAGRASLFALGKTGHPHLARILAIRPLVWLVELGYVLVARNRSHLSRLLPRQR